MSAVKTSVFGHPLAKSHQFLLIKVATSTTISLRSSEQSSIYYISSSADDFWRVRASGELSTANSCYQVTTVMIISLRLLALVRLRTLPNHNTAVTRITTLPNYNMATTHLTKLPNQNMTTMSEDAAQSHNDHRKSHNTAQSQHGQPHG